MWIPTIEADWPLPGTVRACVSLRGGGVSAGCYGLADGQASGLNLGARCGDDPVVVAENRRRLAAMLPGEPCWLDQIHGVAVHCPDRVADPAGRSEIGRAHV